jgi:hypothetical protein
LPAFAGRRFGRQNPTISVGMKQPSALCELSCWQAAQRSYLLEKSLLLPTEIVGIAMTVDFFLSSPFMTKKNLGRLSQWRMDYFTILIIGTKADNHKKEKAELRFGFF